MPERCQTEEGKRDPMCTPEGIEATIKEHMKKEGLDHEDVKVWKHDEM